jgi:adenine-specific DNA-methyltransferase
MANELPEKLPLTSMDIAAEKRDELRRILAATFPEAMSEDKIDLDQLKRVLGEWVEPDRERFGLNWPGKAACMKVIQAPSVGTLKPCPDESVDWDTTQNLFIEGDNLEVLKLLQKAYFGKIRMIYIDPPYNTGNEFIYPDKFSETLETYLSYTGQLDEEGRKFSTNSESSGRYHSRWLSMMYPRIFLAKSLLSDSGVIFISIDDNEQSNLKRLCDEIFGENNFIACIARQMKSGGAKARFFTPNLDYILVYAKNVEFCVPFRAQINEVQLKNYYNKTETEGPRKGQLYGEERLYKASLDARPNQRYWIECPDGSFVIPPGTKFPSSVSQGEKIIPTSEDDVWKWTFDRYQVEHKVGNIVFKSTNRSPLLDGSGQAAKWNIYNKLWLDDQMEKGMAPSNIVTQFENRQSASELKELEIPFDFAKPSALIKYLIEISGISGNDIVLDFFAGSGSTADAVMQINHSDGQSRRWIAVQLPEPVDEESEAFKSGFHNIAEISRERIRRSGARIKINEKSELSLKVEADIGFRAFKLSSSAFAPWDAGNADDEQIVLRLEKHTEHLNPQSGSIEIAFELLLRDGFEISVEARRLEIASKEVFSIADGALLICLEKELTQDVIDAMADMEPLRVICLDAGFRGNDQLKANAVQTFKARARSRETAIEFRTV